MTESLFFENFEVGQRFTGGPRLVTRDDVRAFAEISGDRHPLHIDPAYAAGTRFGKVVAHGPFGLAAFFGMLDDLGIVTDSLVALLDTNWRYLAPVHVGDMLHCEIVITRCRRVSAGTAGVVNRHVTLLNQDGRVVQEGSTAVLLRAGGTGPDPVNRAFATVGWGEELARRLGDDSRFSSATTAWDGTIGLRCGDSEVHLRVYRGRVIEVARRVPLGATFTIGASELTWTDLLTGPSGDFMRRVMNGEFDVRGNAYEYLRLTKVLAVIMDNARMLAHEPQPAAHTVEPPSAPVPQASGEREGGPR